MGMYDLPGKLLRLSDVAGALYVNPNTLRRWSDQERIITYRLGLEETASSDKVISLASWLSMSHSNKLNTGCFIKEERFKC